MDIQMPEMDGITATLKIKQMVKDGVIDWNPYIIMLTAYSEGEN